MLVHMRDESGRKEREAWYCPRNYIQAQCCPTDLWAANILKFQGSPTNLWVVYIKLLGISVQKTIRHSYLLSPTLPLLYPLRSLSTVIFQPHKPISPNSPPKVQIERFSGWVWIRRVCHLQTLDYDDWVTFFWNRARVRREKVQGGMYRVPGGVVGSKSEVGSVDRKRINDVLDKQLDRSSPSTSRAIRAKDRSSEQLLFPSKPPSDPRDSRAASISKNSNPSHG